MQLISTAWIQTLIIHHLSPGLINNPLNGLPDLTIHLWSILQRPFIMLSIKSCVLVGHRKTFVTHLVPIHPHAFSNSLLNYYGSPNDPGSHRVPLHCIPFLKYSSPHHCLVKSIIPLKLHLGVTSARNNNPPISGCPKLLHISLFHSLVPLTALITLYLEPTSFSPTSS